MRLRLSVAGGAARPRPERSSPCKPKSMEQLMADPYPEHGHPYKPAQGYTLHLKVDDVDRWWQRAVAAGAEVVLPLQKMFWGDRYGQLRDPFSVLWSMGQPSD